MGSTYQGPAEVTECLLHDGAVAIGNGTTFDVGGAAIAQFQIEGITTATVTFEESNDGTNWHATTAKNRNGGAEATTATADGIYQVTCLGIQFMRARISSYTTGTIDVLATAIV